MEIEQAVTMPNASPGDAFADFVAVRRPMLRQALIARYGVEVGTDATADAFAYAFEHWVALQRMANPAGYL